MKLSTCSSKLVIVVVIVFVAGLLAAFFYIPYEKNFVYHQKQSCAEDGAKWVATRFANNDSIDNKEYAYSPELNTCLAYVQFATGPFDHGGYGSLDDSIYDIYSSQQIDESKSDIGQN